MREGLLLCASCKVWFPVSSYVPVMLIFSTNFHRLFLSRYRQHLESLSEYQMPAESANPGERSIQETFTDEWNATDLNDESLSFTYTLEDLKSLNKYVWLKWINSKTRPQQVLNVGCGLGNEALALADATQAKEVFGVDLNFALFRRGHIQKSNPKIHFLIASLFNLPFKSDSFDLVYCQGVLHHTYSTETAFESIASYVKRGGRLFTWVYALEDHLIPKGLLTPIARAKYLAEKVLRPLVSRSPKFLRDLFFLLASLVFHPLILCRVKHKKLWLLQNTNHSLRDWLSHRYAQRHSFNEVIDWYESNGFSLLDFQSPKAYRELFSERLHGVGLTGVRTKIKAQK